MGKKKRIGVVNHGRVVGGHSVPSLPEGVDKVAFARKVFMIYVLTDLVDGYVVDLGDILGDRDLRFDALKNVGRIRGLTKEMVAFVDRSDASFSEQFADKAEGAIELFERVFDDYFAKNT